MPAPRRRFDRNPKLRTARTSRHHWRRAVRNRRIDDNQKIDGAALVYPGNANVFTAPGNAIVFTAPASAIPGAWERNRLHGALTQAFSRLLDARASSRLLRTRASSRLRGAQFTEPGSAGFQPAPKRSIRRRSKGPVLSLNCAPPAVSLRSWNSKVFEHIFVKLFGFDK